MPQFANTSVSTVEVKVWGAGGGSNNSTNFGGPGGFSTAILNATAGLTLNIIVGEGGKPSATTGTFGGGGAGGQDSYSGFNGSTGGGRTTIIDINTNEEIIIAGGGGGAAGPPNITSFSQNELSPYAAGTYSNGGSGGGLSGENGTTNSLYPNTTGKGGTQLSGGNGGNSSPNNTANGTTGTLINGGSGGPSLNYSLGAGGGGGGGYFGGGGGSGQESSSGSPYAAGGGGSGYISSSVNTGYTLGTPQNVVYGVADPTLLRPPNTTDPDYLTGLGVGGNNSAGGNGLVVFSYLEPVLILDAYVDKTIAGPNSQLTYTIVVNNDALDTVSNVFFYDTIPEGTTYVPGSLIIEGLPCDNPLDPTLCIGSLSPNGQITVSFKVQLAPTLPTNNPVKNSAAASYGNGTLFNSNIVSTQVNAASLTNFKAYSSQPYATCEDILQYTFILPNSGNTTAFNVTLKDTLPNGTIFIPNTVFINNVNQIGANPELGINVGSIAPNAVSTVIFDVRVLCQ